MEKTSLAALCRHVLDIAGSLVITRRTRRFFDLRFVLPFAAVCRSLVRRRGKTQHSRERSAHEWRRLGFGEGQGRVSARHACGRDAKAHKSLTAVHPATPVAVLTARTIASAKTSAAIAPSAVRDTETFERPVETAMI